MFIDSDADILDQLKKNDEGAFEFLFKNYYKLVYNYARFYISDTSACHDVTQEIFTYIWEKRFTLNIDQTLKAYLLSATHNASINFLKKQSNQRRLISTLFDSSLTEECGYDVIFEEALKNAIEEAMYELPRQCREIFQLSRMQGLKHKEIASQLNLSPKTVETQIYRALKVLRKKLF